MTHAWPPDPDDWPDDSPITVAQAEAAGYPGLGNTGLAASGLDESTFTTMSGGVRNGNYERVRFTGTTRNTAPSTYTDCLWDLSSTAYFGHVNEGGIATFTRCEWRATFDVVNYPDRLIAATVYGSNKMYRCKIWQSFNDGIRAGSETTMEDCLVGGFPTEWGTADGYDHHPDCAQFTGTANRARFTHNTFLARWQKQTSAIFVQAIFGPIDNVLIEDNLLHGGSYTVYLEGVDGQPAPSTVTIRRNLFHLPSAATGMVKFTGYADTAERNAKVTWGENYTTDGNLLNVGGVVETDDPTHPTDPDPDPDPGGPGTVLVTGQRANKPATTAASVSASWEATVGTTAAVGGATATMAGLDDQPPGEVLVTGERATATATTETRGPVAWDVVPGTTAAVGGATATMAGAAESPGNVLITGPRATATATTDEEGVDPGTVLVTGPRASAVAATNPEPVSPGTVLVTGNRATATIATSGGPIELEPGAEYVATADGWIQKGRDLVATTGGWL